MPLHPDPSAPILAEEHIESLAARICQVSDAGCTEICIDLSDLVAMLNEIVVRRAQPSVALECSGCKKKLLVAESFVAHLSATARVFCGPECSKTQDGLDALSSDVDSRECSRCGEDFTTLKSSQRQMCVGCDMEYGEGVGS